MPSCQVFVFDRDRQTRFWNPHALVIPSCLAKGGGNRLTVPEDWNRIVRVKTVLNFVGFKRAIWIQRGLQVMRLHAQLDFDSWPVPGIFYYEIVESRNISRLVSRYPSGDDWAICFKPRLAAQQEGDDRDG